ncbi:MAG: hypothetical protein EA382_13030 [Spirochaetaceae bacterium]|nr:MAG: hypothetical protein EA382_13030 [Spirochaetaceae bacterium]
MSFIQLLIGIVVVGLILWLVNTYIPMQAGVKKILNIVIIIALILYLLSAFGVLGGPVSGLRLRGW